MSTRQHGEQAQSLGPALGDDPRKAAIPGAPGEVKVALAMPESGAVGTMPVSFVVVIVVSLPCQNPGVQVWRRRRFVHIRP
jgi:hypothetical protein